MAWVALSEIYGTPFTNSFGAFPNRSWIDELAILSPDSVEFGLKQCKRSGNPFPPSLPQFLAYCVPVIVEDVYKKERETRKYIQRMDNIEPVRDEVKKQALAEMKNLLKFRPQPQGGCIVVGVATASSAAP